MHVCNRGNEDGIKMLETHMLQPIICESRQLDPTTPHKM
jgi:hypothetical protein